MSFYQLFVSNLKILYRNWRGLFWNILLPLIIYIAIALLGSHFKFGDLAIDYPKYLLPGILAMTIMQTGIYTLAYWLIELKEVGVMKRFAVTPLSTSELLTSLTCSRLLLIIVQVALVSIVGYLVFGTRPYGDLIPILFLTLLGGTIFLVVGFLISVITGSYDEAAPISAGVNLLLTFLGNVFFPISILPKPIQAIGKELPLSFLSDGLRNSFTINGAGFKKSAIDFFALIIWLIIIFAFTVYAYKIKQEK